MYSIFLKVSFLDPDEDFGEGGTPCPERTRRVGRTGGGRILTLVTRDVRRPLTEHTGTRSTELPGPGTDSVPPKEWSEVDSRWGSSV